MRSNSRSPPHCFPSRSSRPVRRVGSGKIVIVNVALPGPPALIALIVAFVVPIAVGVPLINPVFVFTLNTAGWFMALKLVGLFLAGIW